MCIDSNKIKSLLSFDCEVLLLESVDSTNNYIKTFLHSNKDILVVAKNQTAGKGRHGKSFYSKADGIYMSLLINKAISLQEVYILTITAAISVAEALNKLYGVDAKIKWVNDIYCNNKKLCGILCESSANANGYFEKSIIGIGINTNHVDFPADIAEIATSLEDVLPNIRIDKNEIISLIINRFHEIILSMETAEIVSRYKQLSMMIGREITVLGLNGNYPATVLDIDDKAQLVIQKQDGEILSLNSGEISVKL